MKTTRNIFVIIIFFGIIIVTPLIVYYVIQINSDFRSQAALETPQRVVVGNVALDSFTVAWTTPAKAQIGYLVWGTSESDTKSVAIDVRDRSDNANRFTHIVTIRNLKPETTYYYRIVSGSSRFPGDKPFSFKTPAVPAQGTPNVVSIFGDVPTATADTIVYIVPADESTSLFPLITYLTDTSTWFHNAASFYKRDLSGSVTTTVGEVMHIVADTGTKAGRKDVPSSQSPISVALDISEIDTLPIFANVPIIPDPTPTTAPTQPSTPTGSVTPTTTSPTSTTTPTQPNPTATPQKKDLLSNVIDFFKLRQEVSLAEKQPSDIISKDALISALRLQGIITNVTENSFSVVWNTVQKEEGKISYGDSAQTMSQIREDERKQLFDASWGYFHQVTLNNLTPEKKYYYQRNTHKFAEQFSTPKTLGSPPQFANISGELTNAKGECFVRGYLKRGNDISTSQTTIVQNTYSWNMNAGTMRKSDMSAYFSPVATDKAVFEALCIADDGTFRSSKVEKAFGEITGESRVTIPLQ
jgi:hypothetical protein